MRWSKHKKIRIHEGSIDLAADINAAVAVNTGKEGQVTHASSHSEAGVFQGLRRAPEREAEARKPGPEEHA